MARYLTCTWCGKTYSPIGGDYSSYDGQVKGFCSTKCKNDEKISKKGSSSNGRNSGSSDGVLKTALKGVVRGKTAEEKVAESEVKIAEIELKREEAQREHELKLIKLDEEKVKKEKKEKLQEKYNEKADVLRNNGRPVAALLMQYQKYVKIISIIVVIVAIGKFETIYIPIIIALIFVIVAYLYFNEKKKSIN